MLFIHVYTSLWKQKRRKHNMQIKPVFWFYSDWRYRYISFYEKFYHLLSPVSLKYLDKTDGKRNGRYSFFLCCHVTYSSTICLSQFLLNKLHFIFDSHNLISLWHSLLGSSKHNVTFMTCIAKWNQNTIMPMSFNLLNNIKNVSNLVIHRSENIA